MDKYEIKNIMECSEGWLELINETLDALVHLCPDVEVFQIKEKFGRLRVYVDFPSYVSEDTLDKAYEILDNAEYLSASICEICGEPGQIDSSGYWIKTRCEEHLDD